MTVLRTLPAAGRARPERPDRTSRLLLLGGAAAGPLYVTVGVVEALSRRGFDPAHQDLSLLSNGRWGWIHSTLLVVTGVLVLLGSRGARRALTGEARSGPGEATRWGPRLLAVYGVGLCAAGLFVADPMSGFPPGTAAGRPAHVSWHGNLHVLGGALGFLGLIAGCVVFARWYARRSRRGWSRISLLTGVLFAAGLAGIVTGSSAAPVVIGFSIAVVASFAWLTALALQLRSGAVDPKLEERS